MLVRIFIEVGVEDLMFYFVIGNVIFGGLDVMFGLVEWVEWVIVEVIGCIELVFVWLIDWLWE